MDAKLDNFDEKQSSHLSDAEHGLSFDANQSYGAGGRATKTTPPKVAPRGLSISINPDVTITEDTLKSSLAKKADYDNNVPSSSASTSSNTTNGTSSFVGAFNSITSQFTGGGSINQGSSENGSSIDNKKAQVERANLISLTKLIVRDLISSSIRVNRTINHDQTFVHLNNFFTLIDKVLKHGLKVRMLKSKTNGLWNALDNLPKYLKESTLISESIRSLPNTKTFDGKIKAWMRLALMQKKLPEYIRELLDHKDELLRDIYHDQAFMLNDEAQVFAGLIIGVNVIDCNFFVKDENFDIMDDIIDLTPYLKVANSFDEPVSTNDIDKTVDSNITAVLDQKNYLEELNGHLNHVVADLQGKLKESCERNEILEMELKLHETQITKLQSEASSSNRESRPGSSLVSTIKNSLSGSSTALNNRPASGSDFEKPTDGDLLECLNSSELKPDQQDASYQTDDEEIEIESKKMIESYKTEIATLKDRAVILEMSYRSSLDRIKSLEKDLDIQTSMNNDKETSIQILGKEVREKQEQLTSLRKQLSETKKTNDTLTLRLNESDAKSEDRIRTISHLQIELDKCKLEQKDLINKFTSLQKDHKTLRNEVEILKQTNESLTESSETMKVDLKKERECKLSSSAEVERQAAKISSLTSKLEAVQKEVVLCAEYQKKSEELSTKCRDYELSLEEVGNQLRESRLEVENLKENSSVFLEAQWMDSKQFKNCIQCQQAFSVTRRKHHCRLCGHVFCQNCSDNKMEMASSAKPVRVCDNCHSFLLAKFVKSS